VLQETSEIQYCKCPFSAVLKCDSKWIIYNSLQHYSINL